MIGPSALPPSPVMPADAFLGASRTTPPSGSAMLRGVMLVTLLLQAAPLAAGGTLPGTEFPVRHLIEQSSSLQLHQVSPRNDEVGPDGKSLAQRVIDGTEIVPGDRAFPHTSTDADGMTQTTPTRPSADR